MRHSQSSSIATAVQFNFSNIARWMVILRMQVYHVKIYEQFVNCFLKAKANNKGFILQHVNVTGPALVHWNFRAGSTFPIPVCTQSPGPAGATRLTRSDFRWNLLLLKGQRCIMFMARPMWKHPFFLVHFLIISWWIYFPYIRGGNLQTFNTNIS